MIGNDGLNYYTQRDWDRVVGWDKIPDEYSLLKYLEKNIDAIYEIQRNDEYAKSSYAKQQKDKQKD
jgi:hypothetical protein